jgi:hypothetical protein
MNRIIDIRFEFTAFMRKYGAIVSDDVVQTPHQPKNADYILHRQQIIAELKCIENDKLDDQDVCQQVENCLERWRIPRTVGIGEIERVELSRLPPDCVRELSDIKKKPLRTIVESASRQIKATKSRLNASTYQGLLLVANDGDLSLPRPALLRFFAEVLNGSGTGVNSFVLFSVNLTCSVPGSSLQSVIWNYHHPKRERNIDDRTILDMGQKWQSHLESVTGTKLTAIYQDQEIQQHARQVSSA